MPLKRVPVFFHIQHPFPLQHRRKLRLFIGHLFSQENKPVQRIDYILCSDEHLLGINQQFLKHDDLTDIITFDLSSAPDELIGEIYISVERVRENATRFGVESAHEMRRVMFHGALHLCGYNDKTPAQKNEMTSKEDFYLRGYEQFHVEQSS